MKCFPCKLQQRHLEANQMLSFYTTTGMCENGTATLKTHQVFFLFTLPRRSLKTQQSSSAILHLCLGKIQAEKSHHFRYVFVFQKHHFFISVYGRPNIKNKAACLKKFLRRNMDWALDRGWLAYLLVTRYICVIDRTWGQDIVSLTLKSLLLTGPLSCQNHIGEVQKL